MSKTETTRDMRVDLLLLRRREVEKRTPLTDRDLAEIATINRALGVPS